MSFGRWPAAVAVEESIEDFVVVVTVAVVAAVAEFETGAVAEHVVAEELLEDQEYPHSIVAALEEIVQMEFGYSSMESLHLQLAYLDH